MHPPHSPPAGTPPQCFNRCTSHDICLTFRESPCVVLEALRPEPCDCRGCCLDLFAWAIPDGVSFIVDEPQPAQQYLLGNGGDDASFVAGAATAKSDIIEVKSAQPIEFHVVLFAMLGSMLFVALVKVTRAHQYSLI